MRIQTILLGVVCGLAAYGQTPAITNLANNALNGSPATTIAPGELLNVIGTALGDATNVSCGSATGFTNTCGGVSVSIGGTPAAVRNESANGLVIQAPFTLTAGSAAVVVTRVTGGQTLTSSPFNTTVAATAPQMYTSNFNGTIAASCVNSAGITITPTNPAGGGDTIKCYGTGFGVTNPVIPAGSIPPTPLPTVAATVTATLAGGTVPVTSASLTPSNLPVGEYQVQIQIPQGLPNGTQPLVVTVGGKAAQSVPLPVGTPGPTVNTVVNSASNAVPGLPNAGVAPGSIIVVYGNLLGPAALVTAPGYPWPATLSGTSAKVTVNGTTTNLLLYYTSANQIAGLLPSNTPPGNGTITVTYNNVPGGPAPITVAANNFGVYTVPQNGTGPAIVTFADYSLVSQTKAANPGETLIIWGTGLGAVSGDEASGPLPGDMTNLPVTVNIGGAGASVVYRGRSGCCVGEDQIAFVVPQNVTGCFVPMVVRVNNQISNYSLIAVAPSGRACVPSFNLVPPAFTSVSQPRILFVQLSRDVNPPPQFPGDQPSSDDAKASPFKLAISGADINVGTDGPPAGSCYVLAGNNPNYQPPVLSLLDAGPSLTLTGPGGATRSMTKSGTNYSAHLGNASTGNFLDPGAYTLSGPGGADVGSFSAPFTIPQFTWKNQPANNGTLQVNRSQGLTITWSGGDPNGYVQIQGNSGGGGVNSQFGCNARTSDGTFTIPPLVLLAMPGPAGGGISVISVSSTAVFTATGLDFGGITFQNSITSIANFQ